MYVIDKELVCKLCDVLPISDVENFSDHKPLLVTLKCSFRKIIDASGVNNTYVMWNNEKKRSYYTNTCDKLYEIDLCAVNVKVCSPILIIALISIIIVIILCMLFVILQSGVILQVGIKLTEVLSGVWSLAC